MIRIQTFIRRAGEFIPLSVAEGTAQDPQYIEGAIEILVGGRRLLTQDMWDYVDQLWSYFVDGLVAVSKGQVFSTYYPDQPIRVTFRPSGEMVELEVSYDGKQTVVKVRHIEFMRSMVPASIAFLRR